MLRWVWNSKLPAYTLVVRKNLCFPVFETKVSNEKGYEYVKNWKLETKFDFYARASSPLKPQIEDNHKLKKRECGNLVRSKINSLSHRCQRI